MKISRRSRLGRGLLWGAFALGASVALIGVAHTPFGRPLRNALRGAPGCPVDLATTAPAALEGQRVRALESRRGTEQEAGRPALGFELGVTSKADVIWRMRALGVACDDARGGAALRCSKLPESFSPGGAAIEDLHMQFDAAQRLVAVDLFRAGTSSERALGWLDTVRVRMQVAVGRPTASRGARSAAELDRYLQRAVLEYRYRGYDAQVSAINVGRRGVLVREQYQWLPAPTG